MWHFVEGLGKIKQDDIYLILSRGQLAGDALDGGDKLGFTSLSKSMLFIKENVVLLKMGHGVTVDYMFHYFARNRGREASL